LASRSGTQRLPELTPEHWFAVDDATIIFVSGGRPVLALGWLGLAFAVVAFAGFRALLASSWD
jgi:hypothetical protein